MNSIFELFNKFIDFLDHDFKPKRVLISIFIAIIFITSFYFIYSHFSFENRVEKRIANLKEISSLSLESISKNSNLETEYHRIIEEIDNRYSSKSIPKIKIISDTPEIKIFKFLSGALWSILIILLCPFIYKTLKEIITGIILFIFIGLILGSIGLVIPTFISPTINYFAYPILQLLLLVSIIIKSTRKNNKTPEIST